MYNLQLPDWPNFNYEEQALPPKFVLKTGELTGAIASFTEKDKATKAIDQMVTEAIKTSEIEGEFLSREDVMSSIKKNLGIHEEQPKQVKDLRAKGIAYLMVAVHKSFAQSLSASMLFDWHKQLMQGSKGIKAGKWRSHTSAMQVISGAVGRETVHFEAPPSDLVSQEMKQFVAWFNDTAPNKLNTIGNPITRAAIAHLYFLSIHPFEDGNGRIGRAIAEKALFQGLGTPILMSLSASIEMNKNEYYVALKKAQVTLNIETWIAYFQKTVLKAQDIALDSILSSLKKTHFFDTHKGNLNKRQVKVINKMFDLLPQEFEGGMTAKKYMSITKTSKATATRDLQDLVEMGIFSVAGGGRSVSYRLIL